MPTSKLSGQAGNAWNNLRSLLLNPGSNKSGEESNQLAQARQGDSGSGQGASTTQGTTETEVKSAQYAVFDKKGEALNTHFDKSEAITQWNDETRRLGQIIDLDSGQEVTPDPTLLDKVLEWLHLKPGRATSKGHQQQQSPPEKTPPMDPENLQHVQRLSVGIGLNSLRTSKNLDPDLLTEFIADINQMDLPVFNVAQKRRDTATKLVPIRKRRMKVNKKTTSITEEQKNIISHLSMQPSPILEEDMEIGRMREMSDLSKVIRRSQFGLPEEVLARKIVGRELQIRRFLKEVDNPEVIVKSVTKEVIVDEPVVEEYVEYQEVSQEPQGQLLYIVSDASGSTMGATAVLEAAVSIAIIGRNLKNKSRYFWRSYTEVPGKRFEGATKEEKERLIRDITRNASSDGGTVLYNSLVIAGDEIKRIASPDDQPEVLVISDGSDSITATDVYEIFGDSIILHVVLVNGSNSSLQEHASTYVELAGDELTRKAVMKSLR